MAVSDAFQIFGQTLANIGKDISKGARDKEAAERAFQQLQQITQMRSDLDLRNSLAVLAAKGQSRGKGRDKGSDGIGNLFGPGITIDPVTGLKIVNPEASPYIQTTNIDTGALDLSSARSFGESIKEVFAGNVPKEIINKIPSMYQGLKLLEDRGAALPPSINIRGLNRNITTPKQRFDLAQDPGTQLLLRGRTGIAPKAQLPAESPSLSDLLQTVYNNPKPTLTNAVNPIGSLLNQTKNSLPSSPSLTPQQAQQFLQQAGGDKDKARELARQAGFSF